MEPCNAGVRLRVLEHRPFKFELTPESRVLDDNNKLPLGLALTNLNTDTNGELRAVNA
jgi:hypothetical protein